jgi:O-antigen/teichoic acid export membrane protein
VSGLRGVTLAVRFLCELAMLAALVYWGFTAGDGAGAWLLGVGALLAAVVWGALVAPKARWPVPIPVRVVIELVLFGAAVGGLAAAGQPLLAVVLGVAGLATSLLNASQERQASNRPPAT